MTGNYDRSHRQLSAASITADVILHYVFHILQPTSVVGYVLSETER